jgi:RNA polymerase sigma-70 factor (ECF subfamily)
VSEPTAVNGEAQLVVAARQGDLGAWEHLVRRHQEPVFRAAYLLTRMMPVAEAATEAAFIRAYRALLSLDDDVGLVPWLFRIVISEARQKRRDSGRTRPSSRPDEPHVGPHFPATPISGLAGTAEMTPLEREAVVDGFDRLAEEDRLVIASRYLFGLSRAESAAALSMSEVLVEEHLAEALGRLRSRMGLA